MSELIRNGAIVRDDPWTVVAYPVPTEPQQKQAGKPVTAKLTGAEAAAAEVVAALDIPAGKLIVPLAVWLSRRAELAARFAAGEIGVWLDACEEVEKLAESVPDLDAFPVIALAFPKFGDGRAYSSATLLRTRYGFGNELRAIGAVLRDYFQFMLRTGFDTLAPAPGHYTGAQLEQALASLKDFSEPYQGAADNPLPLWRRADRSVAA